MTGSRVRVTRWKRHWLYGELVQDGAGQARVRGWFPRQCAVEVVDHSDCCAGNCPLSSSGPHDFEDPSSESRSLSSSSIVAAASFFASYSDRD